LSHSAAAFQLLEYTVYRLHTRLINDWNLLGPKLRHKMIAKLAGFRGQPPHANLHTAQTVCATSFKNGADSPVAAVTATHARTYCAQRYVDIVMDKHTVGGPKPQLLYKRQQNRTRVIDGRLRFDEVNRYATPLDRGHQRMISLNPPPSKRLRQQVKHLLANIVRRSSVLPAWIAKAYHGLIGVSCPQLSRRRSRQACLMIDRRF
jgi:hypothetical protein